MLTKKKKGLKSVICRDFVDLHTSFPYIGPILSSYQHPREKPSYTPHCYKTSKTPEIIVPSANTYTAALKTEPIVCGVLKGVKGNF